MLKINLNLLLKLYYTCTLYIIKKINLFTKIFLIHKKSENINTIANKKIVNGTIVSKIAI